MFDFCHLGLLFSGVIGESDIGVLNEAQHGLFMFDEGAHVGCERRIFVIRRVADVTERAREYPELPATDMYARQGIELLQTLLKHQGHRHLMEKSADHRIGIQTFVIDIGRFSSVKATTVARSPKGVARIGATE